jgi:hypothetical protein
MGGSLNGTFENMMVILIPRGNRRLKPHLRLSQGRTFIERSGFRIENDGSHGAAPIFWYLPLKPARYVTARKIFRHQQRGWNFGTVYIIKKERSV